MLPLEPAELHNLPLLSDLCVTLVFLTGSLSGQMTMRGCLRDGYLLSQIKAFGILMVN